MATVLIVDDQPQILALAQSLLEEGGYKTLSAATADDALASRNRKEPRARQKLGGPKFVASFSTSNRMAGGCRGMGLPPDLLWLLNAINSLELRGGKKIISWRFVGSLNRTVPACGVVLHGIPG